MIEQKPGTPTRPQEPNSPQPRPSTRPDREHGMPRPPKRK